MNGWELCIVVVCLAVVASHWALPEWWAAEWQALRVTWWERVVGMLITGLAGYYVGQFATQTA
jgi:hypothetical protein